MKFFFLFFFMQVLMACNSGAQSKQISKPDDKTISATAVDQIIKKLMDTAEVTGLGLGIINDNKGFQFKKLSGADGEFILANGKVIKMVISQSGIFEWNKIK